MSANGSKAKRSVKKVKDPAARAPGMQIRCLKCEFTEPWDKHGVRLKASGRTYIFGRCPQCKRVRIRVIEKIPISEF